MPIFDQGYQHWQGPLSGHTWRWLAIARHGVRVQLRNRILRLLLLVAWLPALMLIVAMALWGMVEQGNATVTVFLQFLGIGEILTNPTAYRQTIWSLAYSYFFWWEMYCIMLLVVVAGPGLISRDLRFNALPLYFSRPLTRLDYFVGKLGVIAALVAAVAVGPAVFAYLIGICFSLDVSVVKDTWQVLLASVAYGLVITLSAGTLILAMSSLTRRSLYVGITWAGMWLIGGAVAGTMTDIQKQSARRGIVEEEMTRWVSDNPVPAGVKMNGPYPQNVQWHPESQKLRLAGLQAEQEETGERRYQGWTRANQMAWLKGEAAQAEAARENWWPLCSYVANLNRMADLFLDTDTAWVTIGKSMAPPSMPAARRGGARGPPPGLLQANERRFADQYVLQFPWWWSAGVLTGLLGISTWTLTRRVKSLDRLK